MPSTHRRIQGEQGVEEERNGGRERGMSDAVAKRSGGRERNTVVGLAVERKEERWEVTIRLWSLLSPRHRPGGEGGHAGSVCLWGGKEKSTIVD